MARRELIYDIERYCPFNEQEEKDKALILNWIKTNDNAFSRENAVAHMTASAWVVNKDRSKVLMVYHNIYHSWSWLGGHADGETDLLAVAIREVKEEAGIRHVQPVEKFNSQMQQLFAYIFVHFIAPQQGRQHPLFCWQPVITPILLHRLYHITPFSTIYLYFALFIYPSCRNAQFPQALPKYDLA